MLSVHKLPVSWRDPEEDWVEFTAVCDAVAAGRISAVLACERFGSTARAEKAHKAGHAFGLLLRTVHQCDACGHPGLSSRDVARVQSQ